VRGRDRESAFIAFVDRESDRLQRFATFMCGDADQAADLAQEALTRTFGAWSKIQSADAGGYARRIVVNALRDKQRRDRVRRMRPLGALPSSKPSDESAAVERIRMTALLMTLSPMRRAVVVLRYYEDMTEQQISELLDRPLGTVKSDLHRALNALRPLVVEQTQDA
jgi:RNA polymerase sigma-70 factor (sigma-E family)